MLHRVLFRDAFTTPPSWYMIPGNGLQGFEKAKKREEKHKQEREKIIAKKREECRQAIKRLTELLRCEVEDAMPSCDFRRRKGRRRRKRFAMGYYYRVHRTKSKQDVRAYKRRLLPYHKRYTNYVY